jgi:hypothetical protein
LQNGDLSEWNRPRIVLVIEGVLCNRVERYGEKRRLRKAPVLSYHTQWHELPLKRVVVIKHRYPDMGVDLVTFLSQEFADEAAEYLDLLSIPYDSIKYMPFETFATALRFQSDVQAVYDGDPTRLARFGQLGVQTVAGGDF